MATSLRAVSIPVVVMLSGACAGSAAQAPPPTVTASGSEPAPASARADDGMAPEQLFDVNALAGVLRDNGFELEIVDDKHLLIERDGRFEGRYLMTPHAEQKLIHITKMYVLRRRPADRPQLLELCNQVNLGGIVKTYIDADSDLAIEGYLHVYGAMPASAVVEFAHVFHARADDAAQPFASFATGGDEPGGDEPGGAPGFGDGPGPGAGSPGFGAGEPSAGEDP